MWFLNVFDMTLGHGLVLHYRYGGHDFDMALTWFPWIVSDMNLIFDIWCSVCFFMVWERNDFSGVPGGLASKKDTETLDTILIQFWYSFEKKWYASDMILRCVQNISQKTQQKLNKQKSQLWLLTHIKIIAAKKGSTKQENIPDSYQDHSIHKANTFEHPPSKKAWWCHNIVSKLTKYISLNIHSNSQYLLTMTKSTRNPVIFPWWSALLPWLVLKLLDLFLRAGIKH